MRKKRNYGKGAVAISTFAAIFGFMLCGNVVHAENLKQVSSANVTTQESTSESYAVYYASELSEDGITKLNMTGNTILEMDVPYSLDSINGTNTFWSYNLKIRGDKTLTVGSIYGVVKYEQTEGSKVVLSTESSQLCAGGGIYIGKGATLTAEKPYVSSGYYTDEIPQIYGNIDGPGASYSGSVYIEGTVDVKGPIWAPGVYVKGGNATVNADKICVSCDSFELTSGSMELNNTKGGKALDASTVKVSDGYYISKPIGGKAAKENASSSRLTILNIDGTVASSVSIKKGNNPTGWYNAGKKKYYFDSKGNAQTGLKLIGKKKYYFNEKGEMQTGLKKIGKKTYYFLPKTGEMQTGLKKIGKKTYYFLPKTGEMQTGLKKIGKKTYYFLPKTGVMQTGLKKIGKKTYYFLPKTGVMQTGFKKIGKKTYYFIPKTGVMKTGWLKLKGKKYYFDKKGVMATGKKKIGKKTYRFNKKGVCLNP